jgi:LysM repeat protein
MQRARAKEKAHDIDGAIDQYQKALERKPELARAHLEIGLLYDKYREDHLRAVYHYQRYVEMRPQAEKRDLIEDLIRHAQIAYAASLPDRPSGAIQVIAALKKENKRLREQIDDLTKASSSSSRSTRRRKATVPDRAPEVPEPAPAQPAMNTYRVQRGDTLSSIAEKRYGDPRKWRLIYDANRAKLKSPESLKLGQTLILPAE